jgi:hypothetical protein
LKKKAVSTGGKIYSHFCECQKIHAQNTWNGAVIYEKNPNFQEKECILIPNLMTSERTHDSPLAIKQRSCLCSRVQGSPNPLILSRTFRLLKEREEPESNIAGKPKSAIRKITKGGQGREFLGNKTLTGGTKFGTRNPPLTTGRRDRFPTFRDYDPCGI